MKKNTMQNQFKQKSETISGRLLQLFGKWKVQSGYGTFELDPSLQSKPDTEASGSWVSAVVRHGLVVDYHFESEAI